MTENGKKKEQVVAEEDAASEEQYPGFSILSALESDDDDNNHYYDVDGSTMKCLVERVELPVLGHVVAGQGRLLSLLTSEAGGISRVDPANWNTIQQSCGEMLVDTCVSVAPTWYNDWAAKNGDAMERVVIALGSSPPVPVLYLTLSHERLNNSSDLLRRALRDGILFSLHGGLTVMTKGLKITNWFGQDVMRPYLPIPNRIKFCVYGSDSSLETAVDWICNNLTRMMPLDAHDDPDIAQEDQMRKKEILSIGNKPAGGGEPPHMRCDDYGGFSKV